MVLRMMMLRSIEEEDRSQDQDRDPHFVQACALDMHFNIAQERIHADIYRRNAADQDRGSHFVRACAIEMHLDKYFTS